MGSKGVQTKEMIKNESYRLFASKGFLKVTMKDICEACGLSRGGLYRYYGSTQEIFEALLDDVSGETNEFIQSGIHNGVSAVELLDELLEQMRLEMLDKEHSLSYAIYEYSCTCTNDFMVRKNKAAEQKWQSLIEYGIQCGVFRPANAKTMIDIILYVYQGIRMWSRVIPIEAKTVENIIGKIRKDLVMENEEI